jgi:hypothetical protein
MNSVVIGPPIFVFTGNNDNKKLAGYQGVMGLSVIYGMRY